MSYNTLDVDYSAREKVSRVINKLLACPYLAALHVRNSMCKGYHVRFWCRKTCDLCRFVFDDPRRYSIDYKRPPRLTNVLFDNYVELKK